MTEPDQEILQLEAQITMGNQANQFIQTDLGRYVVSRSEGEEEVAKHYLATVNPTDTAKIIEYQTQIAIAQGICNYFAELIKDGLAAEHTMDQPEE